MIKDLISIEKRLKDLWESSDEEILYGLLYELEYLIALLIENEKTKMDDGK